MSTHAQSTGLGASGRAERLHHAAATPRHGSSPTRLDIGLVNNMPDAALKATERQFLALLRAAADDITVRLTLYTLPEVPRTDFGRDQVSRYSDFRDLWKSHPVLLTVWVSDGMILSRCRISSEGSGSIGHQRPPSRRDGLLVARQIYDFSRTAYQYRPGNE